MFAVELAAILCLVLLFLPVVSRCSRVLPAPSCKSPMTAFGGSFGYGESTPALSLSITATKAGIARASMTNFPLRKGRAFLAKQNSMTLSQERPLNMRR
jgi:hypothetical protein